MTIAILKYNAGNVQSVIYALNRLNVKCCLTDDPERILKSEKFIFPGVGEASSAMEYLNAKGLREVIASLKQPVLGICLGMQLLSARTEENNTNCMHIIDSAITKFVPSSGEKIPHMGWNKISNLKGMLFKGISEQEFVYFVHSYRLGLSKYTSAVCDYCGEFSAAIEKDNFFAVQFHPEKSGKIGEKILQNFLKL